MNIWFATNNTHKKEELEAILGLPLKIPSEEGIAFGPEETGTTFYENALIKARELQKLVKKNGIFISDDSGLCVDALDGRPGVSSANYGMETGKKLTPQQQNSLLLDELGNNSKRSARFVCSIVLMFSSDRFYIFQETMEGEIVNKNEMRGTSGFGYDPVFLIPEYGRTLAELSQEEKNLISHRGKAGKLAANFLCQN
jgi:XTP/dITP diphosphohydrolase